MLKQRVATALVLLFSFLVAVFLLPVPLVAGIFSIIIMVAAVEWAALVGFDTWVKKLAWLSAVAALLSVSWLARDSVTWVVLCAGTLWWLFAVFKLMQLRTENESVVFRAFSGLMALIPAFSALIYLHATNLSQFLSLFFIVWLADIGAYFTGRRWGKHKLAPRISPGKSIEGLVGGIVLVAVFGMFSAVWFGYGTRSGILWVAVCVVTAFSSVVGDLWESRLKRIANVKDSGTLLPGHGGVLDRIDSVTAAAPVFAVAVYALALHYSGSF